MIMLVEQIVWISQRCIYIYSDPNSSGVKEKAALQTKKEALILQTKKTLTLYLKKERPPKKFFIKTAI